MIQIFIQELQQEAAITRKYLARVPFEKQDFQPHPKSEKLGRLAIHVAEIMAWWTSCATSHELDFMGFEPENIQTNEELLAYFDGLLSTAVEALSNAKDSDFEENWSMRYGDEVYFTMPKKQVIRTFCTNHLVHHRAQLGVYLRLLDVAVPAAYGPTADEEY
jgi:uncharacterized damage-inducible protein DinB